MTSATAALTSLSKIRIDRVVLAIIAIMAAVLFLDPPRAPDIARFAIAALASTAPYIGFAVLLLALLKASSADMLIAEAFKGSETRMIVLAAAVGGLAPFCSCEVIPFIAGLLAMGAPVSAVMAFWLSSPLIDPPTLLITASALGWTFAIAKAVIAVALGLAGGFVMKWLMAGGRFAEPLKARKSTGCGSCCGGPKAGRPVWKFWEDENRRRVFAGEFAANGFFLLKWLGLAYVIEAIMVTYVPAQTIAGLVGGAGVLPVVTSAFLGIPAYLNSYAAPPLVTGLMSQGMSAGAAMAFMVGGAVTSIPAMTAVFALVRREVFAAYLMLGIGGAIVSGLAFGLFTGL
ncbi:MAG: permease [Geminicoccaceae bacterium]